MPDLFYITGLEDSGYLFHRVLPHLDPHFEIAQGQFPERLASFDELVATLRTQVPFTEPYYVLGESFGSAVAFEYALAFPDEVEGLIVSGGMVRTPAYRTWRHHGMRLIARLPPGIAQYLVRPIAEWQADRGMDRVHRRELIRRLVERSDVRLLQDAIRLLADYDVTDRFDRLMAPVLALWGENDRLARRTEQQPLMEGIGNIRQVVMPCTSHICLLERPATASQAIIDFAAAHAPRPVTESRPPVRQPAPGR